MSRDEASGLAPPHVLATAERFRSCSGCGRVYWPGSHSERIVERMRREAGVVALASSGVSPKDQW